MEALAGPLGPVAALIVENGGAIALPGGSPLPSVPGAHRDGSGWLLELGTERAQKVAALAAIAATLEIRIPLWTASTRLLVTGADCAGDDARSRST